MLDAILYLQGFNKERLSQYKVLGKLGEGAFGKVFLTQHTRSKVTYATKMVHKEAMKKAYGQRYDQEYSETEIMRHFSFDCGRQNKNLLRLVESLEDDQFFFLVTKMMPGGDLGTYLNKQES